MKADDPRMKLDENPDRYYIIDGPEDETPVWSWRPRDPRLARSAPPQARVWIEGVE